MLTFVLFWFAAALLSLPLFGLTDDADDEAELAVRGSREARHLPLAAGRRR